MHILIAGFQHETNTFADTVADWAAFNEGATFLPACRGEDLRRRIAHANLPAGGFLRAAEGAEHVCTLGFWAGATPSGPITADAFERICSEILADVAAASDADAIYLDLHGAAVSEGCDDCEGELLARVRAAAGAKPLIVSLDLHANVSERMLALADAVVSYRKYPHTDMADTGALAFELLKRRMSLGRKEAIAVGRLNYIIPIISQSTWTEPAKTAYDVLVANDARLGTVSSFCPGFPASDIPECAPCFWAYGHAAQEAVEALAAQLTPPEQWRLRTLGADEAVAAALARAEHARGPVILADVQDNPGAGGHSCTTGVLHALLRAGAGKRFPGRVLVGLLDDAATASAAHAAGLGLKLTADVGRSVQAFTGRASEPPVQADWQVMALSDGCVQLNGPMMTKADLRLGPSAALQTEGVCVAIASMRKQMLDLGLFGFLGLEPSEAKIIVVKSSNHYRAAFSPLVEDPARDIINVKSAAAFAADPADLPYKRLPAGMRKSP